MTVLSVVAQAIRVLKELRTTRAGFDVRPNGKS